MLQKIYILEKKSYEKIIIIYINYRKLTVCIQQRRIFHQNVVTNKDLHKKSNE